MQSIRHLTLRETFASPVLVAVAVAMAASVAKVVLGVAAA
jgi:hypothetical protein